MDTDKNRCWIRVHPCPSVWHPWLNSYLRHFPPWLRLRKLLPSMPRLLRVPKKRPKTFLLKAPVVGKNFCESPSAHSLHRNTIYKTVALIRARTIQFQTGEEGLPALRNDQNYRTPDQVRHV